MKKTILSLVIAVGQISTSSGLQQDSTKEYYGPADKFPKKIEGIKLIGNFNATRFGETDTIVLKADERKGEVFNQRFFRVDNIVIKQGSVFTFSKENPLIIKGRDVALNFGMGTYKVALPTNNQNLLNTNSEYSSTSTPQIKKNIDDNMLWLEKATFNESQVSSGRKKFENEIPLLGGFGKIPWGASVEDTALGGEIDKGGIEELNSLYDKYKLPENQSLEKQAQLNTEHKEILDINKKLGNRNNNIGVYIMLPYPSSIAGLSKNRKINYLFTSNELYMVLVRPLDINHPINNEEPDVIIEAMKIKYGTPFSINKTQDQSITYKWKNEFGMAILVLKPKKYFEDELRKMMLPAIKERLANIKSRVNELGNGEIKNVIQNNINSLNQTTELIKDVKRNLYIDSIIYYSKSADDAADYNINLFYDKFTKDNDDLTHLQQEKTQQKAKDIMNSL
jgi:hypothetical protein